MNVDLMKYRLTYIIAQGSFKELVSLQINLWEQCLACLMAHGVLNELVTVKAQLSEQRLAASLMILGSSKELVSLKAQ